MPYINKPCFNCGKTDKEVHERYKCSDGMVMKFTTLPMGINLYRIVPADLEYWCTDCYRIENGKMEIIGEENETV